MVDITSIKVKKPTVEWLNSLKGYLEYQLSTKLTLEDALITILGEYELIIGERQGLIDRKNIKGCQDFVNYKISIFLGG